MSVKSIISKLNSIVQQNIDIISGILTICQWPLDLNIEMSAEEEIDPEVLAAIEASKNEAQDEDEMIRAALEESIREAEQNEDDQTYWNFSPPTPQ